MADSPSIPMFDGQARRELSERRVLVLDGALDDDNGTMLMTQLLTMSADDPASDIQLWIHSPGGSVPAMLAIRDLMHAIPNDVATLVLGMACSAGQFLLSAGAPGKRRAFPHSRILMHQGSAGIGGSAVDIELQADALRSTRDTVLGLIAEDTAQPLDRIFEDSLHDHWYSPAEALEYGFIDDVLTRTDGITPTPRSGRARTGFASVGAAVTR